MNKLNLNDVKEYVELNIGEFHDNRILKLKDLKLIDILKRQNPYLFKVKNLTASDLVTNIFDSYLAKSEQTIFGNWLEGMAIFINSKVYNGYKSGIEGIDLEFIDSDNIRNIVAIKSGPKWNNSDSLKKMIDHFNTAKKVLLTSNFKVNIKAVNGCCYGKGNTAYKSVGNYYKYCGAEFWKYISNERNLYIDIIDPLGHQAMQKNDKFQHEYSKAKNRFTCDFLENYLINSEELDYIKILNLISGYKLLKANKKGKA